MGADAVLVNTAIAVADDPVNLSLIHIFVTTGSEKQSASQHQ